MFVFRISLRSFYTVSVPGCLAPDILRSVPTSGAAFLLRIEIDRKIVTSSKVPESTPEVTVLKKT
jgi:hypothetical protein